MGGLFQHTEIGAIFARAGWYLTGDAGVMTCSKVVQTGSMGKRTGHIAFADSSGTGNQYILSPSDPLATGWLKFQVVAESSRRMTVQIGRIFRWNWDTESGGCEIPIRPIGLVSPLIGVDINMTIIY